MQNSYLQNLKKNITSEERRVIELKYAGKRFGIMSENERFSMAEILLLKISTITGWTLPISELMNILTDQFQKILLEKYENTNPQEFEYAFRNKGIEIKDWGKAMNLSLIDDVMQPYLEHRFELSRQEESMINKPLAIDQKQELSNEEWEEWIEDIKKYSIELIPISCYDYLLRTGKINPTSKEKHQYLQSAMPIYSLSIQENLRDWNDFITQKTTGVISGKHLDSLITISKRLIVSDHLHKSN